MDNDPQPHAVEYVSLGAFTRDYQIGANGELFFEVGGPGVLGGGGAWAMASARIWNRGVGAVARITPGYPQDWIRQIEASGIDTRGLRLMSDVPAELVFGRYFANGDREPYDPLTVFPRLGIPLSDETSRWGSFGHLQQVEIIRRLSPTADDIPETYLTARAFHVAPMPLLCQVEIVRHLRNRSMLITLDPGPHFMSNVSTAELASLLADVDVFMPSEGEVYSHFGAGTNLADCAARVAGLGPKFVVVKMGTQGSLVYERATERLHRVPIFPARTGDATGAGDSYCGGFMVGYMETGDVIQAALYGTVSASFAVESLGALNLLAIERSAAKERLTWLERQMAKPDREP